jgi:uncharacterized protein DUF4157
VLHGLSNETKQADGASRNPPEQLPDREVLPRIGKYAGPEGVKSPSEGEFEKLPLARLAQRTVGNQAVLRIVNPAHAAAAGLEAGAGTAPLQRKCACGGQCAECKKKEGATLHRSARGGNPKTGVPASVHETLRSPGQRLEPGVRSVMESRFGEDFASVKVHADRSAAASAEKVNALAYTSGDHIVFGRSQYAPSTSAGRELIAHELAHVVQQRGFDGMPTRISDPSEPLEKEADRAANTLMGPGSLAAEKGQAGGTLFRRVVRVNCAANQFGAPDDPRADLETADGIAIDLATQTAADLLTDSQTVQGGIPAAPSASLQAFEDHFGLPVAAGTGFLNRLTGTIRPNQEIALSEELAIVSRRFAGVARLMTQGLSYNCPGNHPLSLIGCLPGNCTQGDAFSCPGNSLVALCSTFWTDFDDNARGQILIHESLHITLGNIGVGSILDATTRGAGRNFNIAGCYEALLTDLTAADSHAECPDVP